MIDINKEAEKYSSYDNPNIPLRFGNHDYNETHKETFIAGHNSKATQAKVLQAQIDVLKEHRNPETIYWLDSSIEKLEKQLKELEDERN
jgi:hypothetical protein